MVDRKFSEFTNQPTPLTTEYLVGLNAAQNDNYKFTIDNISNTIFNAKTSDDLAEGITNIYYTQTAFDSSFSGKDTDDLTQGSVNLYFTHSLSQDLDSNNNSISEIKTALFNSEVVDTFSATKTIDFSTGSKRTITLTGNTTITLSATGVSTNIIRVVQDGTGSHAITFANLKSGLTAPEILTGASEETYLICYYNGTDWLVSSIKVE